jgi:hypothetical protein
MKYAIVANGAVTASGTARYLWPDTSFAMPGPNAEWLAEHGAVPIRNDLPYDVETQILQASEPYLLNGNAYDVEAVERPLGPQPAVEPQWIAFQRDVMMAPSINQMLGTALQGAPSVGLALAVGLGQVAQGSDAQTFLEAWGAGIAMELITPELAELVAAMATTHDLPAEFVAALAAADPEQS